MSFNPNISKRKIFHKNWGNIWLLHLHKIFLSHRSVLNLEKKGHVRVVPFQAVNDYVSLGRQVWAGLIVIDVPWIQIGVDHLSLFLRYSLIHLSLLPIDSRLTYSLTE